MMNSIIQNQAKLFLMLVFLSLGISTSSLAQSDNQSDSKRSFNELVYFEVDPFAYINKGYSLHLGYENWGWRFDLTKVKVDFPIAFEEAFYNTEAFDLVSNIVGFKIDYIGHRENWTRGAFVGLDVNRQKLGMTHRSTEMSKDLNTFNIGIRVGYKINIYKGFYVTPWAALWKNVMAEESFTVGEDTISSNEWDWITTLHIGYCVRL